MLACDFKELSLQDEDAHTWCRNVENGDYHRESKELPRMKELHVKRIQPDMHQMLGGW